MLSVVIPAWDEEETLGPCLASILAQDAAFPVQVVVSVNAATDRTAFVAIAYADAFRDRGMTLTIIICIRLDQI
jgi:glycosyltransferase involved in cell wall biosynthesis